VSIVNPAPPRPPAAAEAPPGPAARILGQLQRQCRRRAGLVIVVAVLLMAALAPWIAPHAPDMTDNTAFLRPPVWSDGGSWSTPLAPTRSAATCSRA